MKQSTRLIVNTGAVYVRMAASVGLGLAYTRVSYALLGKADFGILGVLIAMVNVIFTLSEALNSASDRFLAFELGRADARKHRSVYATLQALFLVVAIGSILATLAFAWFLKRSPGDIPAGRLDAACAALIFQAFASGINVAGFPFRSALASRQDIAILTGFELADAGLRLGAAFAAAPVARFLHTDPLPTLVGIMLVAQCISVLSVAVMALWRYSDTRPNLTHASWSEVRSILGFTGWSLVGTIASRVRMQGPQLLLLMSKVSLASNAAMGLAQQVAGYQNNLGAAIMRAVAPALVSAEGRGDRLRVRQLIHAANKFSLLMIFFFLAPVCVELPTLLKLWLTDPPEEAANFSRVVMLATAVNSGVSGYLIALGASGKIRTFMIAMLITESLALGTAAVLMLVFHLPALCVPLCTLTGVVASSAILVSVVSGLLHVPRRDWIRLTWLPVFKSMLPALAICLIPAAFMQPSIWRMLITGATFAAVAAPLVWLFSLDSEEKHHFGRVARSIMHRIGLRRAPAPPATGSV